MKKIKFTFLACLGLLLLFGCQDKSPQNQTEIPQTFEELTLDQLQEKTELPLKLPTELPFEPIDVFATFDEYGDLYETGKTVEEATIHYIKTDKEDRYVDVTISNLEQNNEEGQAVELAEGTEAIYVEDEIGQLLYWSEGDYHVHLVYYTSDKVNEGQDPLPLDEFIKVANSFELYPTAVKK